MAQSDLSLGVSLSSLPPSKVKKTSDNPYSDIDAYGHDIRRSLLVGGMAIGLELLIYFSGVLDRFF